jgi:pyrimidine deaminase RibD-like protein
VEKHDRQFMEEAIEWADDCHPVKESIPKVGAIIAVRDRVIGRGRRGTGKEGDDKHAERNALEQIHDKSKLADATLYTTLEPCTPLVRSKPLECCTELIRQHQIKKVFVGMLDPNQGVTGKGLWRLQDSGVEVALFPHDLSTRIRIQNAAFIRSQETLGATILRPKDGEELQTYETGGKHAIRFKCLNPPGPDTYLLEYRDGLFWPQSGPFREIDRDVWEIDAHFGSTGEYVLQLVTANDLGNALITYYRKVTEENRRRRERLRGKVVDLSLLGGDYPGIAVNGLPKGLRLEASVSVFVAYKVHLRAASVEPKTIARGKTLKITYVVESSESVPQKIWLGASFRDPNGKLFHNTREDKSISLMKGEKLYERDFTVAADAPPGKQLLGVSVWRGVAGDSNKSKCIASGTPVQIVIT